MFTRTAATVLISLTIFPFTTACQTGRNSVTDGSEPVVQEVEGPMDGLPAFRFICPEILPPHVTVCTADTKLAETSDPLGKYVGKRGAPNVVHAVVRANEFTIHLNGAETAVVNQDGDNRCWAACVLMVSRIAGFKLISPKTGVEPTQLDLSKRLNGTARDEPARLVVIIRALNPQLEAKLVGQIITVGAPLATQSTDRLLLDMCAGSPAIIGLDMGGYYHAVVVIGARYSWLEGGKATCNLKRFLTASEDHFAQAGLDWSTYVKDFADLANSMAIHELTVIDPADGRVRTITGSELAERCRFIMTPQLGAEILTQRYNFPLLDWKGMYRKLVAGDSKAPAHAPSSSNSLGSMIGSVFGRLSD